MSCFDIFCHSEFVGTPFTVCLSRWEVIIDRESISHGPTSLKIVVVVVVVLGTLLKVIWFTNSFIFTFRLLTHHLFTVKNKF